MDEIEARFVPRGAGAGQVDLMDGMRIVYVKLARMIDDVCPDGREKSLALTHLEDSSMRVTRAIMGF